MFIGSKHISFHIDEDSLKNSKQTSVIEHLINEDYADFNEEFETHFKNFIIASNEVSFDLTMRNVISDCLDYDSPI